MRRIRRVVERLSRGDRRAAQPRDAGAAAVEFALVLPILVLILFGIIDYGLYFNDSIDAQSGVQTAARQAVVGNIDTSCAPPLDVDAGTTQDVGHVMCMVKDRTGSVTGKSYVSVAFPTAPPGPAGWFVDQKMVVCEVIDLQGLTGYVPLPRHGGHVLIRSRIVTQIENVQPGHSNADPGGQEGSPPGGWGWCTSP